MARSLDRPDVPDASEHPDSADALRRLRSPADRPPPWSLADLGNRLERLPPGHPSSPSRTDQSYDQPPGSRDTDRQPPGRKTPQDDGAGPGAPPDEPPRDPDEIRSAYWAEVPRFLGAWTDHVRRWPAERAPAVDRSRDPAGSWRGDGGQYLDPEQHAQAKDSISRVQQPEENLTACMRDIEQENTCGGWLDGMKFRLKGEERLKEKIADELAITPAMKPEDAISKLHDAIRYTFCFESANYTNGYWDVKQRLEANDFRMVYSGNRWTGDPMYRGINTRWMKPDGQRFEVQFHTAESFHAKQKVTHQAYERMRNPLTHSDERSELEAFQREVCSWVAVPEGASEIPDHRMKGR